MITDTSPTIDRNSVVIRGTFENTSRMPYRYTFEFRLAGKQPPSNFKTSAPILGSTRYQTPILQPGELHRWELIMRVTDVYDIASGDIGNVRADPVIITTGSP